MTECKFDTEKIIEEIGQLSDFIVDGGNEYDVAEVIHMLMAVRGRLALMADGIMEAAEAEKTAARYAVGPSETKKKK